MAAIEYNNTEIFNWLVSKSKLDVDRHNIWKNTALHYAAKYSRDSILVARLGPLHAVQLQIHMEESHHFLVLLQWLEGTKENYVTSLQLESRLF